MNTPVSFEILSAQAVQTIYRGVYSRFHQEALTCYQEHSPRTSLPNTPAVIKELTNAIIFCNRFNVSVKNTLTTLLNCSTVEALKKEMSQIRSLIQEYNRDLKNTQEVGINQRLDMLTHLPPPFQKNSRIYIKTDLIHSEYRLVNDTFDWLNSFLPQTEQLILQRVLKEVDQKGYGGSNKKQQIYQYLLLQKKQAFKIGHVLKTVQEQLITLGEMMQQVPQETQKAFISFLKESTDYVTDVKNGFSAFRKAYQVPCCRLDSLLFYQLKKINPATPTELFTQMRALQNEYRTRFDQLHELQIKPRQAYGCQDGIDMIIFSSRPCDIATMSTFTDWENCMTAVTGETYYDIHKQIGVGSIIVYGVNSQNPTKKLARILLKPFVTPQTITEKNKISDAIYQTAKHLLPTDKNHSDSSIPPWRRLIQTIYKMRTGQIPQEEAFKPFIDTFSSPVICNPDRIYIATPPYGIQSPDFTQVVSDFTQTHLNKKNVYGTFVPACKFYMDGLKNSYEVKKPYLPELTPLMPVPLMNKLTLFYQNKLAKYFFQAEKDNITR